MFFGHFNTGMLLNAFQYDINAAMANKSIMLPVTRASRPARSPKEDTILNLFIEPEIAIGPIKK